MSFAVEIPKKHYYGTAKPTHGWKLKKRKI
jgi:hypothetical protein